MFYPVTNKDIQLWVRDFLLKQRIALIDRFIKGGVTGNTHLLSDVILQLLAIPFYEDYLLAKYPNLDEDELIACLEDCNYDLPKLRDRLRKLRGVNIDIIELDLISY